MQFDINNLIEKFRYNPNSVKKNYDGKTDIYLAKVSYRYAYFRRILCVLLILVIIAFILSGIGICISLIPYCIKPLTALTGAGDVKMVLEFADMLFIGTVLLIVSLILTVASSYLEKYMNVDIFEKVKVEDGEDDEEDKDEDDDYELFDEED